jgi:excisionase family DNA binding protein
MAENYFNQNNSLSLIEDWIRNVIREEIERAVKGITPLTNSNDDTYLTIEDAAKKLSVNRSTLDRWSKNGLLSKHKVGGRRLYKKSEIEAFVQSEDE